DLDAEIEPEAMAAASEIMAPPAGELEGRHDEVSEELASEGPTSEEPWTPEAPAAAAEPSPDETTAAAPAEAGEIPIEPAPQSTDEPRSSGAGDSGAAESIAAAGDASGDNVTAETSDNVAGDTASNDNVTEVNGNGSGTEEESVESVGGADAMEEVPERM